MDLNEYLIMEDAARDRLKDLRRTLQEHDLLAGVPAGRQPSLLGAALAAVGLLQAGPRERRSPDARRCGRSPSDSPSLSGSLVMLSYAPARAPARSSRRSPDQSSI
jgi:hypothetical protein